MDNIITNENSNNNYIDVVISRVLCPGGVKPFICYSKGDKIEKEYEHFETLSTLKKYYNIKTVTKTEEKCQVISKRGKKHQWFIYNAQVSINYKIK